MIYQIGDITLDSERYEVRRGDAVEPVQPQVLDLLILLVTHRTRIVSKDEIFETIWPGRVMSDAILSSRINAVRAALGDDGKSQRMVKTVPRRGFRFVGEVRELSDSADSGSAGATGSADSKPSLPPQEIRIHTTRDGTRIAYSVLGDGPVLVKTANWMNHLEYEMTHPPWQAWWSRLAASCRLVRYDQRGNGLSDADIGDADFETLVDDLESVIDEIGADSVALLGISQGCAVSIAYAIRHPERVSCMVLYGGYVLGWNNRGDEERAKGEAFNTLIEQGWGQDNPAFRQLFASMFMPDADTQAMAGFNELERLAVTPVNAMRLHALFGTVDVSGLLGQVKTPTLVLHCQGDARAPFEQGRMMAGGIRDCRFVPLTGRNHILQPGEPAWDRFFDEVHAFVAEHA